MERVSAGRSWVFQMESSNSFAGIKLPERPCGNHGGSSSKKSAFGRGNLSFHSFIHSFFLSFFLCLSMFFFPFFCKAFNPEQMISIQIISQAPGLLSDPLRCQWLRSLVCKRSRIPILKRSLGRRWHGRCHFSNSQQPEPTHMA